MIKRVNVIASFAQDGRIRPLWFKLLPEDTAPTYKILSYACGDRVWGGRLRYRCLIDARGKEMEVKLEYSLTEHFWELLLNNSASI